VHKPRISSKISLNVPFQLQTSVTRVINISVRVVLITRQITVQSTPPIVG